MIISTGGKKGFDKIQYHLISLNFKNHKQDKERRNILPHNQSNMLKNFKNASITLSRGKTETFFY